MLLFEQALQKILDDTAAVGSELCELRSTYGRVLAEDVKSPIDVPQFDNSSMDGYALRANDTASASTGHPVELNVIGEIGAGDIPNLKVEGGKAVRIFTGGAIPVGADAVVEQEEVEASGGKIRLKAPFIRGRNIRLHGEDIVKGTAVLEKGTAVTAARVGILASIGITHARVYSKPRVAFLTTGNELADAGDPLDSGKIRDSNSYTLVSLLHEIGCEPINIGRAVDSNSDLKEKIVAGLSNDALITSGGVSVGERDLVLRVLEEVGAQIRFWKVNIKPGQPFAFGVFEQKETRRKTLVFGLPGNPVSTMVTFLQLVKPSLLKMGGRSDHFPEIKVLARLEHRFEKKDGKRHFVRGVLRNENNELYVRVSGPQGSGILTSLSVANCLMVIPEEVTVLNAGAMVQVEKLS